MGNARNAAIREAAGRIIAYVDDDSLVGETWFSSIMDGFAALPETTVGLTGPVRLGLPAGGLPPWCAAIVAQSAFSGQDFGDAPRSLRYPECPIGNNMAFRRSFLEQSGGFSPMLRVYDEHFVCWPAYWKGLSFRHEPAMSSLHTVPENRLTMKSVLGKMRVAGGAYQVLLGILPPDRRKPSRHGMWPEIVRAGAGCCLARACGSVTRAFTYRCVLQFNLSRAIFFFSGRRAVEY